MKFPFRIFLKICSAISDKLFGLVFGIWYLVFGMILTLNFVSIIFFRTWVFRELSFFRVMILFLGSMLCFRIVRKTFLSV